MLSLISLLLASGTVLRIDTEKWTAEKFPNPKTNHTACNSTADNSTLCDPDHVLTDQERAKTSENVRSQIQKLLDANIQYADKAPAECSQQDNATQNFLFYTILARRINGTNNSTAMGNDLTAFGDKLAQIYGLNELPCKNFVLLIAIETAKLVYVRIGRDLKLPSDLMERVYQEYQKFNAKHFMAGLNKIIEEIGNQMTASFKDLASQLAELDALYKNSTNETVPLINDIEALEISFQNLTNMTEAKTDHGEQRNEDTTKGDLENTKKGQPWWMIIIMAGTIIFAISSLTVAKIYECRRERRNRNLKAVAKGETKATK